MACPLGDLDPDRWEDPRESGALLEASVGRDQEAQHQVDLGHQVGQEKEAGGTVRRNRKLLRRLKQKKSI